MWDFVYATLSDPGVTAALSAIGTAILGVAIRHVERTLLIRALGGQRKEKTCADEDHNEGDHPR